MARGKPSMTAAIDRSGPASDKGLLIESSSRAIVILSGSLSLIVAFRPEFFFSALAVAGFSYEGIESSPLYVGFVVATSVAMYAVAFIWLCVSKNVLIRHFIIMLMPALMTAVYLFDLALGRTQETSGAHFLLAVAFAGPAAVAGMVMAQPRITRSSAYAIEPLMLLFSIAVLLSAISTLQGSVEGRGVGGATYQTASYLGAVAYTSNLYYLVFGRSGHRPIITMTKTYSIISLVLLPLQIASVLLSGGRGGFVLIGLGTITITAVALRAGRRKLVGRILLISLALIPILAWSIPQLLANPTTSALVERVFSYFGNQGIDWSGTSGRDVVYGEAIMKMEQAPLVGYGIFSWGVNYYPHNFWLEVMLNGGIVYAMIWLALVIFAIWRGCQILGRLPAAQPIIFLMLYPLVLLQFSGSYWTSGFFWFALAYLACTPTQGQNNINFAVTGKRSDTSIYPPHPRRRYSETGPM